MKLRHLPSLCAALLALCPTLATAQTTAVPGFISYQGRVVDAAGVNVGKDAPVNRTVIFRIWDSPSSTATANLIYSESQTVTVSDGEFSVLVGQGVANTTQTFGYSEAGTDKKLADFSTAFNRSPLYLGVTVATTATIATTDNEITPRQQIVSTAFAMRAKVAGSVDASAISSTMLATGAVGSTQLAAASVTNAKLGTDAVLSANIGNLNVTTAKLADLAVTTGKIADNAVDNTKLRDSAAMSVIGRTSSVVGDPADIVAAADGQVLRRSGTSVGFGTVGTAGIADAAITGAKIASDANVSIGQLSVSSRVMTGSLEFWGTGGPGGALWQKSATTYPTNTSAANGEMVLMGNPKLHLATATGGEAVMTLSGSNVGIGTTTPTKARLEVLGSVNTAVPAVYAHTPTNIGAAGAMGRQVSIYSEDVIWANDWIVSSSDERIKTISGISDGAIDLRTLMGVNVTNYTYKDVIGKGNAPQKKLIAQQVEKVFPMAVSQQTDVVPDIYKQATIQDGWVELATDLKKGERVKLITDKDEGSVHEVLEVMEGKFRTDFKPVGDKVFVFGREVNDFRTVDYDAIAMLNVSATQQIKREKDAEIQALRDENATLRRELAAKDTNLETRLIALERSLSKGNSVKTVSLRTAKAAE